jgi:hypothetical protein
VLLPGKDVYKPLSKVDFVAGLRLSSNSPC